MLISYVMMEYFCLFSISRDDLPMRSLLQPYTQLAVVPLTHLATWAVCPAADWRADSKSGSVVYYHPCKPTETNSNQADS